ncbi:MAG: aspartyl-tRNA amidotransferase subunit B [Paracoccaceae bacterium]|nr:MAG: GatB/YqeY domain-containing protein [Alphaproteobacteria bacterium]GIX14875.1 MAG: aspartyl-tRNA amidotransferase subunit B [Paracoccaceae bacterium]
MRQRIQNAMKAAMRSGDSQRLSTLRLILAAIKDREIAARSSESADGVSDAEIAAILSKMVRQRQESARLYEEAGRLELAEQERAEIATIEEFLPRQLSEEEMRAAITRAIEETGARSVRDMGKVMGVLRTRYAGQMDFGKAGEQVKAALG